MSDLKTQTKWLWPIGLILLLLLLMSQSCYNVRIVSTKGAAMPPIDMDRDDWYRDKWVIEIDTVVKAGTLIDEIMLKVGREGCESGKLFSVEYKDTFGGNLLYLITFGSRRKVKLLYVCMKPNE